MALADAQFATVAQGAVAGLIGSVVLITLWLFLAVRTWRLIVPILGTLALGLMLTLLFATLAVGTLNLVSVGFGVLFVGIAVDFAIQFSVRYRERRFEFPDPAEAMRQTARRVGGADPGGGGGDRGGIPGLRADRFSGVAELGLIAGVGMLIAFVCTMTLPARGDHPVPSARRGAAGRLRLGRAARSAGGAPAAADPGGCRRAGVAGRVVSPRLQFDSDPLDTQNPNTEAMRTLRDLINNPLTNPYSIDVLAPNVDAAQALAAKLKPLPTVSQVIDIDSFVPDDQQQKLAIIADAQSILAATLAPPATPAAPITPDQVRLAAKSALAQIEPALAKLPAGPSAGGHRRRSAAIADRARRGGDGDQRRADPLPAGGTRPAAHRAECRAGDAGIHPAGHGARLAAAGRPGARAGDAEGSRARAARACGVSSMR